MMTLGETHMSSEQLVVKRWMWEKTLSEAAILRHMETEGMKAHRVKNESGQKYLAQRHEYAKIIYVIRGSITYRIPESGEEATLHPGDKLEIAAGVNHEAEVGPYGVVYLEGHHKIAF
jgi:quercetin dioxygenase-like cupin family protein